MNNVTWAMGQLEEMCSHRLCLPPSGLRITTYERHETYDAVMEWNRPVNPLEPTKDRLKLVISAGLASKAHGNDMLCMLRDAIVRSLPPVRHRSIYRKAIRR